MHFRKMLKLDPEEASKIAGLLNYRYQGLVVAIAQDAETSEVLMSGFMDAEAVKRTLMTGLVHYMSLSRRKIWLKGEKSGHFQRVEEVLIDCDNDTLLLKVKQEVGACHLGYKSCFFRKIEKGGIKEIASQVFNPEEVYGK